MKNPSKNLQNLKKGSKNHWANKAQWKSLQYSSEEPAWMKKMIDREEDLYNRSIEDNLYLWTIYTMMKQRNISRADVSQELKCSRQRVQQLLLEGSDSLDRVAKAITDITIERHHSLPGHSDCEDSSCGVYLICHDDDIVARKKASAKEEWLKDGEQW